MPRKTLEADWYDHPQYYDLAFRSETVPEANFIEAACRKYCDGEARRLFEPACGTGRLVTELACRGYEMVGLDLSKPSLRYLKQRLARRKLHAEILHGDMSDFQLSRPVDAAYSTFDGFRHLLTEEAALRHLQAVARSLRPGGIYLLGFHLLPPDADEECTERWSESRGQTKVTVTLRVLETDRRRRIEKLRVCLLVRSPGKERRLRHDFEFRMYTAGEFTELLEKAPELELCDVYDFWYDIDDPLVLDDEISDTVFVLKKRGSS
jgi:SAM-dependent methyltransferase